MKRKEIKELITLSAAELENQLKKIKADIGKIFIELKLGRLKNTSLLRDKQKDIARLKTFIRLKRETKE